MSRTSHEEANRRLILDVYEKVLGPLDASRVDDYFAPDYIQHSPLAASGAKGLKAFLDWARANSPAATHHVKRVFVDGDHVIAHVHVVIHPGDRGRAVVDIFRIAGGKVAEHWDAAQEIPVQSANANGMF
ncbi:MAG: nuclear transport factor 2 family protein [Steroidobacteraceae bacterium]